ncbi:ABC-2 type transport system permease protein [Catenulispora sp. EB89]|uniref:ABC transporter permease n=1 Tax=Catenulispora sp. EB89 TaxID=3156257 RepID=UPI00351802B7
MKNSLPFVLLAISVTVTAIRVRSRLRARATRDAKSAIGAKDAKPKRPARAWLDSDFITASPRAHELGLVAGRELRERLRGRLFRVGTLLILAAVAAAIVIPTLHKNHPTPQKVGVVSTLTPVVRSAVQAAASAAAAGTGTTATLITEPDAAAARDAVHAGQLTVAVIDDPNQGVSLLVDKSPDSKATSVTAQFVRSLSVVLGEDASFQSAGLSPQQAAQVADTKPLSISSLQPASKKPSGAFSVIGIVLIFMMLTQYNTWTLMGVMEEKSSRVAEVLLSAVRPARLLTGKVLGIGVAAFAQAALIVTFALVLAESVGSTLMRGSGPLAVAASLTWLLLGYAFYSWVYAAAGSLAERRDQVQSLALPLSMPILFGYAISLSTITGGAPSTFYRVLAYLPPTAPFAMPTLVGFGDVAWWQFAASVVISIAATVGVARFAAVVYRRSILRTGRRVGLRDLFGGGRTAFRAAN